jgi:hypothetical protein
LSGIKALSYFGITGLHSAFLRIQFPLQNPLQGESLVKSPLLLILLVLLFCVDFFFLIGGLLIARSMLQALER